ncbi:MAG: 4Fe-4S binding protein [Nitrospirae bacterium]|nr:4Fe-4S binding protein [Nitrospirota bacterium]
MKGKIIIDRDICKGCGYCIKACQAKLISLDKGFNALGHHPAAAFMSNNCNGCGLCAIVCPDIAIEVFREG